MRNASPSYRSPMQRTGIIWIRCWAKKILHVCATCESGLNFIVKQALNILRKRISACLACFMLGFWMFSQCHGNDYCVKYVRDLLEFVLHVIKIRTLAITLIRVSLEDDRCLELVDFVRFLAKKQCDPTRSEPVT